MTISRSVAPRIGRRAAALSFVTAAHAASSTRRPSSTRRRSSSSGPTRRQRSPTNRTVLYGDPDKPGLYIYINKFKPNRFGNPHYHPNDRFITVLDGAG